jgi:internalin A
MSEPQANQPMNFSSFADWCKHKDTLSKSARHTVEVLLKKAGTSDCNEVDKVLLNLTKLNLENNKIADITPLSALTNLTSLSLSHNQITDITGLSALTNLTELDLYDNQITDISRLSALTNLTELDLSDNQITNITPLSGLTNLTDLDLQYNQITDITGLSALTNLTWLHLKDNPIIDLNLSIELAQKYLTLSTTPIDSLTATETAKKLYAAIDRTEPQVIVCSSPQVASIKIPKQLKISWNSQLQKWEIAVGYLVRRNRLLNELFQLVDVGFFDRVRRTLWSTIIQEPSARLQPSADDDILVYSEFQDLLENYRQSLGGDIIADCYYIGPLTPRDLVKEIHFTEFLISKFGVTLDDKAQELLRCKQELLENCGWIFPFENICVVCDRPLHLHFDSEHRLHAEGESAIAFADGYSLYFHHGVKLPEQYGKVHPDLWQAEWLLSEENAEIRRLLIQRIGYDRICQQLQAVELDSWQEYTLLKIDNADVEPIYLLKMTCPSTGFIHALRVPPDVESAKEAIRWVNWDIKPEEFSVQT